MKIILSISLLLICITCFGQNKNIKQLSKVLESYNLVAGTEVNFPENYNKFRTIPLNQEIDSIFIVTGSSYDFTINRERYLNIKVEKLSPQRKTKDFNLIQSMFLLIGKQSKTKTIETNQSGIKIFGLERSEKANIRSVKSIYYALDGNIVYYFYFYATSKDSEIKAKPLDLVIKSINVLKEEM